MEEREDLYSIFIASCLEQIQMMEAKILDLEKAPPSDIHEIVAAIFRGAHSLKGDANTIGLSRIADLSHRIENTLDALRNGRISVNADVVSRILKDIDQLKQMILACRQETPDTTDNLLTWMQASKPSAHPGLDETAGPPHTGQGETIDLSPDPEETPPPFEEPRTPAPGQTIQRISIAAERLDSLLAPVGELSTLQIRLNQLASQTANDQMITMAREIERISEVLRGQILGMRMLALDTIVSKYRRLIRDLSRQLGKNCRLRVTGEGICLDKGILEKLNLALIHILRNALAHGIEAPEKRSADGKPASGQIELSARQMGSEVEIIIRDDGAGINTARLEEIALQRGLIPPGQHRTHEDLLDLIFLPGMSSSEAVDTVSGRGVGMDSVGEIVDALHGKITVHSQKGQHTSFTIQIPLTLAIMDFLKLEVAGCAYYLHLDYVIECFDRSAEPQAVQDVMEWRGQVLPLVDFRKAFDLCGSRPSAHHIVVLKVRDDYAGLIVDRVDGLRQGLFKSLGPVMGRVDGILGATLTENGDLALIIDVPGLIRLADQPDRPRQNRGAKRHA
jgi:two-component system chemotaxis sensor kinase CheA